MTNSLRNMSFVDDGMLAIPDGGRLVFLASLNKGEGKGAGFTEEVPRRTVVHRDTPPRGGEFNPADLSGLRGGAGN
jgi:hypothetical protein